MIHFGIFLISQNNFNTRSNQNICLTGSDALAGSVVFRRNVSGVRQVLKFSLNDKSSAWSNFVF